MKVKKVRNLTAEELERAIHIPFQSDYNLYVNSNGELEILQRGSSLITGMHKLLIDSFNFYDEPSYTDFYFVKKALENASDEDFKDVEFTKEQIIETIKTFEELFKKADFNEIFVDFDSLLYGINDAFDISTLAKLDRLMAVLEDYKDYEDDENRVIPVVPIKSVIDFIDKYVVKSNE